MIGIGLKRVQIEALWGSAQSALISQSEFFHILNQSGASGLLAQYIKKGVISLSKPARSEMNFARMLYQEYCTNTALFFTFTHSSPLLVDIENWRLSIEGDGVDQPEAANLIAATGKFPQ
ncbi:MAG: hypothetical protein Q8O16_00495 [Dehalococcoidia bacterium]|nr:hypothetical protein [Dehalococcoidia bacterium]